MIIKIIDSNNNGERPVWVNTKRIEAITVNEKDVGKIKVHFASGKEWRADFKYLEELIKHE